MTTFDWIKHAFDYVGGAQGEPPPGFPIQLGHWWFWAVWWGAMALAIYVFSGQSSKFIYIDF